MFPMSYCEFNKWGKRKVGAYEVSQDFLMLYCRVVLSQLEVLPFVKLQGSRLSELLNATWWFPCSCKKSAPRKC